MNYLLESRAFHESIAINQLTSGQVALWHALLDINNKTGWKTWFTVPNSVLMLYSGLHSVNGVHNARNVLKQKGYIDFKPNGTKATKYRLISLTMSYSDRAGVIDSDRGSDIDRVIDSDRDRVTLYKQNKTKQNKDINQSKLNARVREDSHIPIFKLNEEAKQDV